jgi:muconate cycloisomerase
MDVRIDKIRLWEVIVPGRAGSIDSSTLASSSLDWSKEPICLLELTLSDGTMGLGEISRGIDLAALAPTARKFLGQSPWEPGQINSRSALGLQTEIPGAHWETDPLSLAMQTALLDAAARRAGCRVVDLLGGAYRRDIPVDYWCGRQTPGDLAHIAGRARQLGFRGLKMKSQLGDPVLDQVEAIRTTAGENFGITIDPMFQWFSPEHVLGNLKRLEPHSHMLRIEDPFSQDMPDHWRRLRQAVPVPLIWHARDVGSLRRGLQEKCADAFNCGGGPHEFLALAHAVEVSGYACWHGSAMELGVSQVAHLHAAAASRACTLPSDCISALIREHSLITWDWPYRNGSISLPEGDGLGIELDHTAIKRFQRNFAEFSVSGKVH